MSKITTLGFVLIVLVACTTRDTRSLEYVEQWQGGHRSLPMENGNDVLSESYMSNIRVQSDRAIEKRRHESAQEVKAGLGTVQRIMEEVDSAKLPENCRRNINVYRKKAKNYMLKMRHCIMNEVRDLNEFRNKKRQVIDAAIKFIREINDTMTELDPGTLNGLVITVKTLLNQVASVVPISNKCVSKKIIQNIVRIGKEFLKGDC